MSYGPISLPVYGGVAMQYVLTFVGGVIIGVAVTLLAMAAGMFEPSGAVDPAFGTFMPAEPSVVLLGNHDRMRLTADFGYSDSRGKIWTAPKDYVSNGASIPQPLWSIVGSRTSGPWSYAAILHDWHCEKMIEPSDEVHRMFYEACRANGTPERKAKMLYAAVYHFGPSWKHKTLTSAMKSTSPDGSDEVINVGHKVVSETTATAIPTEEEMSRLIRVEAENPALEEIESMEIRVSRD
jgi:hypothetical protein